MITHALRPFALAVTYATRVRGTLQKAHSLAALGVALHMSALGTACQPDERPVGRWAGDSTSAGQTGETPGGPDSGEDAGEGQASTGRGGPTGAPSGSSEGDTGGRGGGPGGGDFRLDVGSPDGDDPPAANCDASPADCGCTAVDLLFVIDNSLSMEKPQEALAQAFPAFVDTMIEVLPPGTSLRVAATSSEMGRSSGGSTNQCASVGDNGQPQSAFYITTDAEDTGRPASQGRLNVFDGKPFFEIDTSAGATEVAAMKAWFSQAARLGSRGSNIEMTAAAAGWVGDPVNERANGKFIRDLGAVLVVFFLQDEPDQTPATLGGRPGGEAMLAKLAAAKSGCGGTRCIIGGGVVNTTCLDEVPLGTLLRGLSEPPVVADFPFRASPTAAEFAAVLEDTLAGVIAKTCARIPPPPR